MDSKLKIVFVHSGKAALPELKHYEEYFSNKYDVVITTDINDAYSGNIVWLIMGTYRYKKKANQIVIKEFPSLSLNPLGKVKNLIKTITSYDCDIRVYLNDEVKKGYYVSDCSNVTLRDMGVTNSLSNVSYTKRTDKFYDLVYVGDMSKSREIDLHILKILESRDDIKIALVGRKHDWLVDRLSDYKDNVEFLGYVEQDNLYKILDNSRAAINIMPDKYPYNMQTSTKLQEYAVFGIPIVTTEYQWAAEFLRDNRIPYITINDYINGVEPIYYESNLDICWSSIINKSKIEDIFLNMMTVKNSV